VEIHGASVQNVLRLFQIRLTASSLEKIRQPVKTIRRNPESPIRVAQTQSAFHPRAQRDACRRLDVRPQSRLFVPQNPRLKPSPNFHPTLLRDTTPIFAKQKANRRRALYFARNVELMKRWKRWRDKLNAKCMAHGSIALFTRRTWSAYGR
jgi:hypothetical protein